MDLLDEVSINIRNNLDGLPKIVSIEDLKQLCSSVENNVLTNAIAYTKKYADKLFKHVSAKTYNDFIVDDDCIFYSIRVSEDLLSNSKLIILISNSKTSPPTLHNIDINLLSTGKYRNISIILPQNFIKSEEMLSHFYKCIFETSYSWFKEQVLAFVSTEKINVARELYAFLHSLTDKKEILENFWFAIVGQGYGFRLLNYDLTLNAFEIIARNINDEGSTNQLVTELLSTKLPTGKILMQIAVDNKTEMIGNIKNAVYTSEGSIYSVTLYTLYNGECFVINPIYIGDFNILALYSTNIKKEAELIISRNLKMFYHIINEKTAALLSAFNYFSNVNQETDEFINNVIICANDILYNLYKISISISPEASIDIIELFTSTYKVYDRLAFDYAIKILEEGRYIIKESTNNYRITANGISCISIRSNKMSETSNKTVNNYIFGGEFNGSPIGSHIEGDINNGIDFKQFNDIIFKILDTVKNTDDYEEVKTKIELLEEELKNPSPKKKLIKEIVDWIQKITSIAGFGIKLASILSPIL